MLCHDVLTFNVFRELTMKFRLEYIRCGFKVNCPNKKPSTRVYSRTGRKLFLNLYSLFVINKCLYFRHDCDKSQMYVML